MVKQQVDLHWSQAEQEKHSYAYTELSLKDVLVNLFVCIYLDLRF